jgi:outer membrane immunogenic protein
MNKALILVAAFASLPLAVASAADMPLADMPLKAPLAPVPYASYNWTGFYAGVEAGPSWGSEQVTRVDGGVAFPNGFTDSPVNLSGFLGGVYAGYNYQINQFVFGVDGDYTWADLTGSGSDASPLVAGSVAHENVTVNWIATVTGRLGYAVNDWLLFVKGGGAWAGWSSGGDRTLASGAVTDSSSSSDNRDGWTVGGGFEYAFLPHASLKLEYDYVGLNTASYSSTVTTISNGHTTSEARTATWSLNIAKIGLGYKF